MNVIEGTVATKTLHIYIPIYICLYVRVYTPTLNIQMFVMLVSEGAISLEVFLISLAPLHPRASPHHCLDVVVQHERCAARGPPRGTVARLHEGSNLHGLQRLHFAVFGFLQHIEKCRAS